MALLTGYWGLDGMILMIIAVVGFYMYMTRKFLYWKKRGVVEIPPTAFTGNFTDCLLMKQSPGEFVKALYDQTANLPYMGFYIFDKPFFLARDPDLIKNILVRDFNYFSDRFAAASPSDVLGNANLFILKNPAWKFLRTKLTPIFTSGKLKKMFELMLEVGEDLMTHLTSLDLKGEGRVVEVKDLCAKYTTDLIGTTAYGLKVNSLNNPNAEFRQHGREIFEFNLWRSLEMTSLFFAPQVVQPMGFKFFTEKSSNFLRHVFWNTIIGREKSGMRRNDFIDLLVDLKKNQAGSSGQQLFEVIKDKGSLNRICLNAIEINHCHWMFSFLSRDPNLNLVAEFDGDNLVAQAAIFFTGGFETSSTVLSFAMYELALAPKIQTKLREEIIAVMKESGGKLTYDMAMNLPYMDMVVSETLRKYPPLPFLDRVVTEDYKVPDSNLVLEKGTPVYIPMLGLHYDPEYFPDPEVFDPERFTEENKRDRKPFVYMPFGDGPHSCIGLRLGLLQTKLGLIHTLSEYQLSPCKETQIPMKQNPKALLTQSDGGLYLNIKKLTTVAG